MHTFTSQHLNLLISVRTDVKQDLCTLSALRNLYNRPKTVSGNCHVLPPRGVPIVFQREAKLKPLGLIFPRDWRQRRLRRGIVRGTGSRPHGSRYRHPT